MGLLEQPGAVGGGTGESALQVPEELGLEQVFRQGSAIHGDERAVRTVPERVKRAGDETFSGAGFSRQKDGHLGVGDALDEVEQCPHRRAFAHQVGQREALAEGAAQEDGFAT